MAVGPSMLWQSQAMYVLYFLEVASLGNSPEICEHQLLPMNCRLSEDEHLPTRIYSVCLLGLLIWLHWRHFLRVHITKVFETVQ